MKKVAARIRKTTSDRPVEHLDIRFAPASVDAKARTFEATVATETPVKRFFGREICFAMRAPSMPSAWPTCRCSIRIRSSASTMRSAAPSAIASRARRSS
ncbi:hypothetical protein NKH94_15555 [Mesorhizobium australicum]|uniref:hypothetical protein n=1 Tax=Mesorhizobium australicum TaxID=536018 RepID=UPI0033379835